MALKKELNFNIPILVTLLTIYPLIFIPNIWPAVRWLIFLILSFFSMFIICKEKLLICHRCYIPLALFLIFVFISSLFSLYPWEAWLGASYYFTGFLSYLCFAILFIFSMDVARRLPEKLDRIIDIWLWSVLLVAIIGLLQYFGLDLVKPGLGSGSYSTIGNSNDNGSFLVMAFPFAAMRILQKPNCRAVAIFGVVFGSILTTLCRGAWIGFFVGFIITLFFYPIKNNVLVMIMVMLIVAALLVPVNNWHILRRVSTASNEIDMVLTKNTEAGSGRFLLWRESIIALPKSPLVGTGPDTLLYASQEKFERRFGKGIPIKAHNIYLEIAVTMGIPALLMYLWFLGSIMYKTDLRNPMQFAFFVMVVIYLVRGFFLVDVITVYPLFWVLLGFYQGLKGGKYSP